MTISATNRKSGPYVTNGVTTNFAYDFTIAADDELEVYKLNTSTNVEEILSLDSDYTVTGAGDAGGGNVVISPALGAGFNITIKGVVELSQETDFDNQGGWHPDVHEQAFDKLTKVCIDLQEQLDRCLKVNITDDDPDVEFDPDTGEETFVKRQVGGDFVLSTFTTGVLTGVNGYGDTASRPAGLGASDAMKYTYFDTDLGYPIFWNGTSWSTFSGVAGV
jgi:hypothetical protein